MLPQSTWASPLLGRLLTLVITTANIEEDVGWGSADKWCRLMKQRVGFEEILGMDETKDGLVEVIVASLLLTHDSEV
jgi:hypothetical protein